MNLFINNLQIHKSMYMCDIESEYIQVIPNLIYIYSWLKGLKFETANKKYITIISTGLNLLDLCILLI